METIVQQLIENGMRCQHPGESEAAAELRCAYERLVALEFARGEGYVFDVTPDSEGEEGEYCAWLWPPEHRHSPAAVLGGIDSEPAEHPGYYVAVEADLATEAIREKYGADKLRQLVAFRMDAIAMAEAQPLSPAAEAALHGFSLAGETVDWTVYGAGGAEPPVLGVIRCRVVSGGAEVNLEPLDWEDAAFVLSAEMTMEEYNELRARGVIENCQPEHCRVVTA